MGEEKGNSHRCSAPRRSFAGSLPRRLRSRWVRIGGSTVRLVVAVSLFLQKMFSSFFFSSSFSSLLFLPHLIPFAIFLSVNLTTSSRLLTAQQETRLRIKRQHTCSLIAYTIFWKLVENYPHADHFISPIQHNLSTSNSIPTTTSQPNHSNPPPSSQPIESYTNTNQPANREERRLTSLRSRSKFLQSIFLPLPPFPPPPLSLPLSSSRVFLSYLLAV